MDTGSRVLRVPGFQGSNLRTLEPLEPLEP
jgi:hypothetical protein